MGLDITADAGVDFVPQFGQKEPVLRRLGNFINMIAIHDITGIYYNTSFVLWEEVFLVRGHFIRYNIKKYALPG